MNKFNSEFLIEAINKVKVKTNYINRDYSPKEFIRDTIRKSSISKKDIEIYIKPDGFRLSLDQGLISGLSDILSNKAIKYNISTNSLSDDIYTINIVYPNTQEGYNDLIDCIVRMCAFIKIVMYTRPVVTFIDNKSKSQKLFSNEEILGVALLAGTIPYFIINSIGSSISESLAKGSLHSQKLLDKLLKYLDKDGGVVVCNIGSGSFYMDILGNKSSKFSKYKEYALKNGDSEDPRNLTDYVKLAIIQEKNLICYSDRNSTVAIAHEIGHYLLDKGSFTRKIQNVTYLLKNTGLINFIAFILGVVSLPISIVTGLALKAPELLSEFMASHRGLEVLRQAGATEEDIKKAKHDFKLAFLTYLSKTSKTVYSSIFGSIMKRVVK